MLCFKTLYYPFFFNYGLSPFNYLTKYKRYISSKHFKYIAYKGSIGLEICQVINIL